MAQSNTRSSTLTIGVQTSGTDSLEKLSDELTKLSKKAGDSAPEFQRIADELKSISQQTATVNSLQELTKGVDAAAIAMRSAQDAARRESEALAGLKVTLDNAKEAEGLHAAKVREKQMAQMVANAELTRAKRGLQEYVTEIGGANSATDAQRVILDQLRQAVRQIGAQYLAAKQAVVELAPESAKLADVTTAATTAFKAQQREVTATSRAANSAKAEYDELNTALETTSQQATSLGVDTKALTAEQNRLTQSAAKLTEEAKKLKTALEAPGASATSAGQRIEQAFGVVGVRSAASVRDAITRINQAMVRLASDSSVTGAEFQRAFDGANAKIKELEKSLEGADTKGKGFFGGFGDAIKSFGPATLIFNGITAAVNALTSAATQVPKVAAEFQTLSRTLTILTGSTTQAAKEIDYLKGVSNRVGTDVIELSKSYVKLTAATKDTALEGAKTRAIFESVSGAMGALGASSAETGNAVMALTQMISKGVISQEEWRQQLAERLPGAAKATADELGLTTAELNKLIETGKLAAEDVLPALEAGLSKLYKTGEQNDTLVGKWNQFTNALKASANAIGETGMIDKLLEWGRVATSVAQAGVEQFLGVGKAIGVMTAGIVEGSASKAWDDVKEHFNGINKRMLETAGLAPKTQQSLRDMALEAEKAGQKFVVMGDGTKYSTDMILKSSEGFLRFLTDINKAQKAAEDFATTARKTAEYTRSAGEATITAANALGDEATKRRTATEVAEKNAAALLVLRDAEQKVVDVMQKEAAERQRRITDGTAASAAHKQALKELQDEIDKRQAVVDGVGVQVAAQEALVGSLRVEAETLKDNSGRLEELRKASEAYSAVLPLVKEQVDAGNVSQADYNRLLLESTKAKALHVDALQDQKRNIESLNSVRQSQLDIESAGIRLAIEQKRTIYEVAKARGDEYTASQALMDIKRLEIQLADLAAKGKVAEARAALAKIEVDREELRLKGALTPAMENELRARTAAAEVKLKEAEISTELAKRMRELSDVTGTAGVSAGNAAGGYEQLADSMNNAADAAVRLRSAQQSGIPGSSSNGIPGIAGTAETILDDKDVRNRKGPVDVAALMYARDRNASVQEVQAAMKYYGELYQRGSSQFLTGNLGTAANANRLQKQVTNDALDKALELARRELATGQAIDLGPSVDELAKRNLSRVDWSSKLTSIGGFNAQRDAIKSAGKEASEQTTRALTTVNININGRRNQITTDSRGAAQLTEIFRGIEADANRSY